MSFWIPRLNTDRGPLKPQLKRGGRGGQHPFLTVRENKSGHRMQPPPAFKYISSCKEQRESCHFEYFCILQVPPASTAPAGERLWYLMIKRAEGLWSMIWLNIFYVDNKQSLAWPACIHLLWNVKRSFYILRYCTGPRSHIFMQKACCSVIYSTWM